MAALIDMSNNRANIAYVGEKPWHGLGDELLPGQPIERWRQAAGLDFTYRLAGVKYLALSPEETTPILLDADRHRVVYRDDTKAALACVGTHYQVVQPNEILEFFRDLTEHHGFLLETAGSLRGGSVIWALASTGMELRLGDDYSKQYVLLMTSCDAKMATRATLTSVRVVCWNTLTAAIDRAAADLVTIPHTQRFNAEEVRANLGLTKSTWSEFSDAATEMSKVKLKDADAKQAILRIFGDPEKPVDEQPNMRAMGKVLSLYDGHGLGSSLPAANGTAWGLLNAVTEYVDHHAVQHRPGGRLASAWTGQGAQHKRRAFDTCLALAA